MSLICNISLSSFVSCRRHSSTACLLPTHNPTTKGASRKSHHSPLHPYCIVGFSGTRRSICVPQVAADGAATTQVEVSVEEVMNPQPVLLEEHMNIKDAVHKMLDANVSGAPVVNGSGQLVGVLTEADVIWKGAGRPEDHYIIPPVFIGFADAFVYLRDNKKFDEEVHKILARTVSEAMAKDQIIKVAPSTPMSEAAQLMLHHDVNLLPVVESDGKVVGVVTRHDILRGIYASKSPFLG